MSPGGPSALASAKAKAWTGKPPTTVRKPRYGRLGTNADDLIVAKPAGERQRPGALLVEEQPLAVSFFMHKYRV